MLLDSNIKPMERGQVTIEIYLKRENYKIYHWRPLAPRPVKNGSLLGELPGQCLVCIAKDEIKDKRNALSHPKRNRGFELTLKDAQEAIEVAKSVITLVSKEVWKKPIKW